MDIKKLVGKIQTKKFKNLDEKTVVEKVNKFLNVNPRIKLENLTEKSSDFKKIIKYVKKEMHRSYGAFQSDVSKRERLLGKLKNNPTNEEIKLNILKTHSSTRERLDFYNKLKKDLSEIIEGKSILDLGSGLNPLMFDENEITAVEFNKNDVDFLNEYFKIKNLKSKSILIDLNREYEKLKNMKTDVVFALKIFDIIDTKKIESIIKNLDAKYLIASFSTKTLGGRWMNLPRRTGFQKMLRRLNLSYRTLSYENELFYIVELAKV